jgi:hypothetical protein
MTPQLLAVDDMSQTLSPFSLGRRNHTAYSPFSAFHFLNRSFVSPEIG